MNVMAFYEKVTNKCFNYEASAPAPKVFKVNLDIENIHKFFKDDCALKIILKNGKDIIIDCFFSQSESNQLILETAMEEYFLISLSDYSVNMAACEIRSIDINNLKDIADDESGYKESILKWLARGKVGMGGSQRLSIFNLARSV